MWGYTLYAEEEEVYHTFGAYILHFTWRWTRHTWGLLSCRGRARIFCLGGPNFGINILVSSQDKPFYTCVNVHTQISILIF